MAYRSLLSLDELSLEEITAVLDAAATYLPRVRAGGFKDDTLRGRSVLLLFYEASTRTRVSFELAGKLLGADTINVSAKGSSVEKGESIADTAQTLSAMGLNAAVMRHSAADAVALFNRHFAGAVLNAGSGRGEHPSQALLDALTLRQAGILTACKRIAIVGDIEHSRVMRSSARLLARFGMQVTLVAPPSLMPLGWQSRARSDARRLQHATADERAARFTSRPTEDVFEWSCDLDSVLPQADAVMMLRMQRERMSGGEVTTLDEFSKLYGLNSRRLKLLPSGAAIMHPGPVNRGVEVSEAVFSDPRCRINDQVSAGVAVRCALLRWACGLL